MIYLTLFLFICGILGAFYHHLPSTTLVFLGIYFYALKEKFHKISKDFILILAIITAFAVIFDNSLIYFKKLKRFRLILKLIISIIMIIMFLIKLI